MNLLRAATLVLLLPFADAVAKEDGPRLLDVPSAADLAGAPRVAELPDGRLAVASPVAGGVDVVVSDAAALAFGPPVAALRRGDLMVGGRRGPRIAAAGDVLVLAAITSRTKDGGGDLLTWTSKDAGVTWTGPARANDVPGCAAEGLFDLAGLGDGRFVLVWLDGRKKGTRLVADFSADGAAWGADVFAYESPDGSICECCHPAVAAAPDGGAVAAFRNSIDGERDVWTARLAGGATTFAPATRNGCSSWKLDACPMAGPAVGVDGLDVVAAWRRGRNVYFVRRGKETDLGEGTEPALVVGGPAGVRVYFTCKDELRASGPDGWTLPLARDASTPSAVAGRPGVVWLDVAKKRARLAVLR